MLKSASRSTLRNSKSLSLRGFRTMTETWKDGNLWTKKNKMEAEDSMWCRTNINLEGKEWEVLLSTFWMPSMKATKEVNNWNTEMMLGSREMEQGVCTWKWVEAANTIPLTEMPVLLWNSDKVKSISQDLNLLLESTVMCLLALLSCVLAVVLLVASVLSRKK